MNLSHNTVCPEANAGSITWRMWSRRANIAAAGTAIDLSAASHGYFLELDWTPGSNLQAANRLVSMQKSEKVIF